jgi:hypothetical protein
MALSPDLEQSFSNQPNTEAPISISTSSDIFIAPDFNFEEMSRDERIRHFYASEVAKGNVDVLTPRHRLPDNPYNDDNNPFNDVTIDPVDQIGDISALVTYYKTVQAENS